MIMNKLPNSGLEAIAKMTPIPRKPKFPRWVFFALFSLNVADAVYCLTHDRHAFTAIGGLVFAAALLWNLYHAVNHGIIPGSTGEPPLWTRTLSPVGFWFSLILYLVLYILSLLIPPLVRYSAA